MSLIASAACLLLAWPDPPAPAPKGVESLAKSPAYVVMQVKSGLEIVVKKDGAPVAVRLVGTDTPKLGPDAAGVAALNQTKHLRGLVAVGSKVRLAVEPGAKPTDGGAITAHVFRGSDDRWVNRAMVEEGYASAAAKPTTSALAELQAAEKEAQGARLGMWSPDFLAKADKPARFEAPVRPRPRSRGHGAAIPPGGGPALGAGFVPAPAAFPPVVNNPMGVNPGFGYGYGYNPTPLFGGYGGNPLFLPPGGYGYGGGLPFGAQFPGVLVNPNTPPPATTGQPAAGTPATATHTTHPNPARPATHHTVSGGAATAPPSAPRGGGVPHQ